MGKLHDALVKIKSSMGVRELQLDEMFIMGYIAALASMTVRLLCNFLLTLAVCCSTKWQNCCLAV